MARDLRDEGVRNRTPNPTPANVNTDTGEIYEPPVDYAREASRIINEVQETGKVTGMDGKQYYRPNQSASDTAGPRLCDNYRLRVSLISSASLT